MRQAGILAAAGLYALEHHVERLAEDHRNARGFAEAIASAPGLVVDPAAIETNIIVWDVSPEVPFDGPEMVTRAKAHGLLLNAVGPRRIRAVTHLDVSAADCARGAQILHEILKAA